jgi:hypothetical protein
MAVQEHSVIARFYDILDGITAGDPVEFMSDDCEFEMMFPSAEGIPNERIRGGKEGFKRFLQGLADRGARFQRSGSQRRHNISTLTVVDGLELMVGKGVGGRRNGGLVAAAQEDNNGKLRRYIVGMTSVVFPEAPDRPTTTQRPEVLPRFFDLLDGFAYGDPVDILSEDFEFEMVFPGIEGPPDERVAGGKEDFRQFMETLYARGRERHPVNPERRHYFDVLTVVDGLELMLGRAVRGRRNGTLVAAAQQDPEGRLQRYACVMSSVVFPEVQER